MNEWKGSRTCMLSLIALCLLLVVSIPHAAAVTLTFEDGQCVMAALLPDGRLHLLRREDLSGVT